MGIYAIYRRPLGWPRSSKLPSRVSPTAIYRNLRELWARYWRYGDNCGKTRGPVHPSTHRTSTMFIENRSPPKEPIVSVTAPASSNQARIAFNAALVRHTSLQDVPYMAIHLDEERP